MHLGVAAARLVVKQPRPFVSSTRHVSSGLRHGTKIKPIPASLQIRLFDVPTQSRLTLDYLDTLHPGSLLCQVMAVNLVMAYFALVVSPNDTRKVDAVVSVLLSLQDKVESALRLLSLDATAGIGNI